MGQSRRSARISLAYPLVASGSPPEAKKGQVSLALMPSERHLPVWRLPHDVTRREEREEPATAGVPLATANPRSAASRMFGSGDARGGGAVHAHRRGEDR